MVGKHRIPDFTALKPVDDRLQAELVDQTVAEIIGVAVPEQPGQLLVAGFRAGRGHW